MRALRPDEIDSILVPVTVAGETTAPIWSQDVVTGFDIKKVMITMPEWDDILDLFAVDNTQESHKCYAGT